MKSLIFLRLTKTGMWREGGCGFPTDLMGNREAERETDTLLLCEPYPWGPLPLPRVISVPALMLLLSLIA